MQVLTFLSGLPAANGEFGVSRSNSGKPLGNALRHEVLNNIDEWTARPNWRKLPWVADQDQPMHTLEGLDQGRQYFLGQHGGFVDDNRSRSVLRGFFGEMVTPG